MAGKQPPRQREDIFTATARDLLYPSRRQRQQQQPARVVHVHTEAEEREPRPPDWRAYFYNVAGLVLGGEALAIWLSKPGWARVGSILPLSGLVLDGWLLWKHEHSLGRQVSEALNDLKVTRGLKHRPRLLGEEMAPDGVSELLYRLPPGLTAAKLWERRQEIVEALHVAVLAITYDEDRAAVVIRVSTGRLPREVHYLDEEGRGDVVSRARALLQPKGTVIGHVYRDNVPPAELRLPVLAGIGREGAHWLDLAGSHVFLCGLNRSGKSSAMRQWITRLASTLPPSRLQLRLLDLKMGAVEFEAFGSLPHLGGRQVASTTAEAKRLLEQVKGELEEQERRLASRGKKNIEAWNRAFPEEPLPYVLVFVDEASMLSAERAPARTQERATRSEIEGYLGDLAQRGPGAGFRMVLATQYGSVEAVPSTIREQLWDTRLVFRMASQGGSQVVLGAPDAFNLPRRIKGRAVLREGDELRTLQTVFLDEDEVAGLLRHLPQERPRVVPTPAAQEAAE